MEDYEKLKNVHVLHNDAYKLHHRWLTDGMEQSQILKEGLERIQKYREEGDVLGASIVHSILSSIIKQAPESPENDTWERFQELYFDVQFLHYRWFIQKPSTDEDWNNILNKANEIMTSKDNESDEEKEFRCNLVFDMIEAIENRPCSLKSHMIHKLAQEYGVDELEDLALEILKEARNEKKGGDKKKESIAAKSEGE